MMLRSHAPRLPLPATRRYRLAVSLALAVATAGCFGPRRLPEEPLAIHKPRQRIGPFQELIAATFHLEKGEYIRAVAAPEGFDLALSLESPAEPKLKRGLAGCAGSMKSDSRPVRGANAAEEIAWVAQVSGTYRLRICSFSKDPGRYGLKLWGNRHPSAADRLRARAVTSSNRAEASTPENPEEWRERLAQIADGPQLWSRFREPQRLADAFFYLGQAYARLSQPGPALDKLDRALALYGRIGNPYGEAETRIIRGNVFRAQGDPEAAVAELTRALETFARIPEDQLPDEQARDKTVREGIALSNRGNAKIDLERLAEAIADLEEAIQKFAKVDSKSGLSTTLGILGTVHEARTDLQRAREAFERALEYARQTDELKAQAQALHGLGTFHMSAGEWSKASGYFSESIELQKQQEPTSDTARSHINKGRALFYAGDRNGARKAYADALGILAGNPDREAEIGVLNNLALLELEAGATEAALGRIQRALGLARDDEPIKIVSLELEGAILRRAGQLPAARLSLERGLELGEKLGTSLRRGSLYKELALLELNAGAPETARHHAEQALQLVEGTRSQLLGEEQRSAHLASRRDYYDVYITTLLELGRDEEAFELSERARARSLLETLGDSRFDLRAEASPALLAARRRLLESVQSATLRVSQLRKQRSSREEVRRAEALLNQHWEDLSDLEDRMREASPRYAALTRSEPLPAREIRRRILDGDALLLAYWLGEEQSVLWAVTADGVRSFTIPRPRAAIERWARCFYEGLLPPEQRRDRRTNCSVSEQRGTQLSAELLEPVAGLLGERPLLVVTDGALQTLPFFALPDPTTPGSPLLARHPVSHLPSASVLAALREQTAARRDVPWSAALFADPVFRPTDPRVPPQFRNSSVPGPAAPGSREDTLSPWQRLPDTEDEAQAVCGLVRPARCDIFSSFAASTARVKSLDLSPYRILHFATHGDVNSEMPGLSRLVLSLVDERGRTQPGFLHLYDIYDLKLEADLVVLSACNTARGKEIRGEGLIGLTRGFMYAGAKSVVASLWNVDSAATQRLMSHFYRHLIQEGLPPAQALRTAQLEMARSPWPAPHFWAGFILQGEWR